MNKYDTIELVGKTAVEEDVRQRIATTGVRGLSFEKAQELGLFRRISLLLTTMHTTSVATFKIYKQVDDLLDAIGGRRNDIAKACKDLERAMDKFVNFWSEYYTEDGSLRDIDFEVMNMYKGVLKLAGLPEKWKLGDAQELSDNYSESVLVIDYGDRLLRMSGSVIKENVIDSKESWCVTKYDVKEQSQICVHSDMDKASAMMIAKRMSGEDKENIYTASQVMDIEKTETVVTPVKAYQANETIGKVGKTIKM